MTTPPTNRTLVLVDAGAIEYADGLTDFDGTTGGGTPTPSPTLQALSISPNTATVGVAFTATINGRTSGSALALSGAGAAGLSISGNTLSGTPTASGAINITETLAGATGSPRPNNGVGTVAAAGGTALQALSLSPNTATAGTPYNGTITGKTSGSTIALTGAGADGLSISGTTVSGTPTSSGAVNTVETLGSATNSPRTTNGVATVAPAAVALQALSVMPNTATAGTAYTGTINGKTSGSALALAGAGAAGMSISGTTLSGTPTSDGPIDIVETLNTATNSPRTSNGVVTVAVATPVTGDPMSFAVRGPDEFDKQYANGSSGTQYGVNGDGWVGELVIKGMSPGQTFDATKVTLTVQDPGFDNAGAPVTRTRTIKGGKVLREQYPNAANSAIYAQGSDVLIRFSLSDFIYVGSTITSVDVAAGAYGASNGKTVTTVTQGAQLAYPRPTFAWIMPPRLRQTGNSLIVEAVAFHQMARFGQMVACVKYQATDGTNVGAEATSGTATLSTTVTNGRTPECYPASVDCSTLTNGAECFVNAKVYPWIGNAAAVLNLATDGVAWPTANPQTRLQFVCDRTGAYGGVYAYVKLGASGGAVSTTAATARTTPFPDMSSACNAIRTANQARGHDDMGGGIIRFMDDNGSPATHARQGADVPAGNAWYGMERDPAATAAVTIKTVDNFQFQPGNCKFGGNGLLFDATSDLFNYLQRDNPALTDVCLDGLTIKTDRQFVNYVDRVYYRNVTMVPTNGQQYVSANSQGISQMWGVVSRGVNINLQNGCSVYVGCRFQNPDASGAGAFDAREDGFVMFNNEGLGSVGATIGDGITSASAITRGVALVQNIIEYRGNASPVILVYFADGQTKPVQNVLDAYNMIVGERGNRMYCDEAGAQGIVKRGVEMYGVVHNWNLKTDTFDPANHGRCRTGNWAFSHGVGKRAMVSLFGSKSGSDQQGNAATGGYQGDYWPPDSEAALASKSGASLPTYVRYAARTPEGLTGGTAGAGDGDYRPTGANNPLYNRVPVNMGALRFDMNGIQRRTDGSGAIGPFERTV